MENWKEIKGFEGYYEVSDLGRIRSVDRTITYKNGQVHFYKSKLINQQLNPDNEYLIVKLNMKNKQITKNVHRLVLETFILNPDKKPLCNHKNGIKQDNRVSNLEWCTQSENMQHAVEKLGFDNKNKSTNKKTKCSNGKVFNSTYDAARWINNETFNNIRKLQSIAIDIRNVCNKKIKKRKTKHGLKTYIIKNAYGFSWEYID